MPLTQARCPDCQRDLEWVGLERYGCPGCKREWSRVGLLFEPVGPRIPVARLVRGGEDLVTESIGPRSACCDVLLEESGWEKMRCRNCKKIHVRIGIQLVPE